MVTIETNLGSIKLELDPQKAPVTCANFLKYCQSGFFEGTIFHRVIKGFMIQGGGFTDAMQQKNTNPAIKNEADNGLKNDRYTIAMARTPNPDSATSQFFINVADNDFLNEITLWWRYAKNDYPEEQDKFVVLARNNLLFLVNGPAKWPCLRARPFVFNANLFSSALHYSVAKEQIPLSGEWHPGPNDAIRCCNRIFQKIPARWM